LGVSVVWWNLIMFFVCARNSFLGVGRLVFFWACFRLLF